MLIVLLNTSHILNMAILYEMSKMFMINNIRETYTSLLVLILNTAVTYL